MAIAKVKSHKLELTPQAILEMAIGAGIAIVSIVLILLGVARWRLKHAAQAALEKHDSNNPGLVIEHCRDALARDESYHPARQLLAKVLVDEGAKDAAKLAEAETEYKKLLELGYTKGNASVGLGVIYLLRAASSTDSKAAGEHLKTAEGHFKKAKSDPACPEADIGLGHVELFRALRLDGSMDAARNKLEAIHKSLMSNADLRSKITREGLVDLYAGLGRAHSSRSSYNRDASLYYRLCYGYAPQWSLPIVNMVYIDAQRIQNSTWPTKNDFENDKELTGFTQLVHALVTSGSPHPGLQDAYEVREIALITAWGQLGELAQIDDKMQRLWEKRYDALLVGTQMYVKNVDRQTSPQSRGIWAGRAADYFKKIAAHDRAKGTRDRVIALNNAAVMLARSAIESTTAGIPPAGQFEQSVDLLRQALEIEKDNYTLNRNMALMLKCQLKDAKPHLDAARKASGAKLEDLDKIEKWNP